MSSGTGRLSAQLQRTEGEVDQLNATLATARLGVDTVRRQVQALHLNPAVLHLLQPHP